MKRILSVFAVLLVTAAALAGCGQKAGTPASETTENNLDVLDAARAAVAESAAASESSSAGETAEPDRKLNVICTIFPLYDWTREIVGENADKVDLTLLIDNGIDLHNYQPSTADMAKISACDLLIYVGGPSDAWIDDAIRTTPNENRIVIKLFDTLGSLVKTEEIKEGMEHDHDDDGHDHNDGEYAEAGHEHEYDEHVWLSLRNAQVICQTVSDSLSRLDQASADFYAENTAAYCKQLDDLDREFRNTVEASPRGTVLFADRFPFRYLINDYDLDYYAAFPGCSAETEASFETIVFLADKVDQLKLRHLLIIDGSDASIADTIAENAKEQTPDILSLNSMQSVSAEDMAAGASYLTIMEQNLETLKQALEQ